MDAKREEFRKYLEKEGVLEFLTKQLVKLYEETDKPENALDYLKSNVAENHAQVSALKKVAELEKENLLLKENILKYEERIKILENLTKIGVQVTDEGRMTIEEPNPKTPEIPKEKEVSPTNFETDKEYKTEEENSSTVLNDKTSGPDMELDVLAENDSTAMEKVEETEAIHMQELPADAEKEGIITEIESAMSETNGLTDAAEEGKLSQEAIENRSALVEKAVGDNDADDGTLKDVFDAANQKTDNLGEAQEQEENVKMVTDAEEFKAEDGESTTEEAE